MGRARKKLRIIVGVVRDTTAIAKAFVTTKRTVYQAQHAVLQATRFTDPTAPPSDATLSDIISAGQSSRRTASVVIEALIHRLHDTRDAYVALKCLYTVHSLLQKGSFGVKGQLLTFSDNGGRNFLNMSTFRDKTDHDSWELSSWVRWYAAVIEQELTVCRVVGYFLSFRERKTTQEEKISWRQTNDLISEVDALVELIEVMSGTPPSSMETKALLHESIRLVGDDYGLVQREIALRTEEVEGRRDDLSYEGLSQVVNGLKRMEACKEKLSSLFLNRKRNDAFWEKMDRTKANLAAEMEEKGETMRLVVYGTWR